MEIRRKPQYEGSLFYWKNIVSAAKTDVFRVQRLLQGLKLGQLHDDGNLVHAGIQPGGQRGVLDDLDRGGDLLGAGLVMSSSPRSVFSFTSSSA